METALKEMDQVKISRDVGGHLTTGTVGVIVEADRDGRYFDYLVAFPTLRVKAAPDEWVEWTTDKLDLSQFRKGDVVPMSGHELEFIQSLTPED